MNSVRESFSEYKKTLEQVLSGVNYLYSGDVISSTKENYIEMKNTPLTSPSFIVNSIQDIYYKSLSKMFQNSQEIILPKESFSKDSNILDDIISKLPIKPHFIFCSEHSKKIFGITRSEGIKSLPNYFYPIDKYVGLNIDVFYSPLIQDDEGDQTIYVVDSSIQSLVWSIQNMDYLITPLDETNTNWEHKMLYDFYDCRYISYKIVIRNVSKIRDHKINTILSGN